MSMETLIINSTNANSPLAPELATSIDFSWNGFEKLPHSYQVDLNSILKSSLMKKVESGIMSLNLTIKKNSSKSFR